MTNDEVFVGWAPPTIGNRRWWAEPTLQKAAILIGHPSSAIHPPPVRKGSPSHVFETEPRSALSRPEPPGAAPHRPVWNLRARARRPAPAPRVGRGRVGLRQTRRAEGAGQE